MLDVRNDFTLDKISAKVDTCDDMFGNLADSVESNEL